MIKKVKVCLVKAEKALTIGAILMEAGKKLISLFDENDED